MSYSDDSDVQDQESDTTPTADNAIQIPMDCEAGKAVAAYTFSETKRSKIQFFVAVSKCYGLQASLLFLFGTRTYDSSR